MPSEPSPLLQIEALHCLHLGPIDLSLNAGQCLGLSGASGSGKSVLLRAIAELVIATGQLRLAGQPSHQFAPAVWRRQVALLPANSQWWGATVAAHFPTGYDLAWQHWGFTENPMQWPVPRLSTGERQRLALARVLALQPQVLLLDEPTANLDEANVQGMVQQLLGYQQQSQAAVLWVAHDIALLEAHCQRRCQLQDGVLQWPS